jgi:hypothetical protein
MKRRKYCLCLDLVGTNLIELENECRAGGFDQITINLELIKTTLECCQDLIKQSTSNDIQPNLFIQNARRFALDLSAMVNDLESICQAQLNLIDIDRQNLVVLGNNFDEQICSDPGRQPRPQKHLLRRIDFSSNSRYISDGSKFHRRGASVLGRERADATNVKIFSEESRDGQSERHVYVCFWVVQRISIARIQYEQRQSLLPRLSFVSKWFGYCFSCDKNTTDFYSYLPLGPGGEKGDEAWSKLGVNNWSKMKGRGKLKKGLIRLQHSSSSITSL